MFVACFAVIGEIEADSLIFRSWAKTDEDLNHEGDQNGRRVLEAGRVFRCVRYARPRPVARNRSRCAVDGE